MASAQTLSCCGAVGFIELRERALAGSPGVEVLIDAEPLPLPASPSDSIEAEAIKAAAEAEGRDVRRA